MRNTLKLLQMGIVVLVAVGPTSNVVRAQAPIAGLTEAWVARYDRPGQDWANSLAVDSAGDVFVTGSSESSGQVDYVTIKYDGATGNQAWLARYDGGTDDAAAALAIDSAGNVYVTGYSQFGQVTIKYDGATGAQLWLARFAGPGQYPTALVVDSAGAVYVTGGGYAVIKYDGATGNQVWIADYDGPASRIDNAFALAIDSAGDVFVTGRSEGLLAPYLTYDYATIKYDGATGAQLWVARYDGAGASWALDQAWALAVDSAGDVYVTGDSYGPRVRRPGGTVVYSAHHATIKYDGATGAQLWVARDQGTAKALAVDSAGDVYVTGWSTGDYATIKYDGARGDLLWLARYDGPDSETYIASALAVDSADDVYVTGRSESSGQVDYVTIKYDGAIGNQVWLARYDGPDSETDKAWALAVDSAGNVYVTGWDNQTLVGQSFSDDGDYATIKYITPLSVRAFSWAEQFEHLRECIEIPGRWPSRGDLPIDFAGPSCPPPFPCPECALAARWEPGPTPPYLPEIYFGILRSLGPYVLGPIDPHVNLRLGGVPVAHHLVGSFEKAPVGRHFSDALKASVMTALTPSKGVNALPPEAVGKLVEAINALELDWRVPSLSPGEVNRGEYAAVDFQGAAWAMFRNVAKAGKAVLSLESGLPAAAFGFEPGWPMATYRFDFTGQLEKDGYVDVSFHIGGIRIAVSLSSLRILEWDGKSYKDITTHVDPRRGVITGRSNRLTSYVLMAPTPDGPKITRPAPEGLRSMGRK